MVFRSGLPLLFIASCLFLPQGICGQPEKTSKLSPKQRKLNLQSFEQVWSTVQEKYWDPKMDGLDWQKIHDQYRPKILKATNQSEVRELLSGMLGKLGKSHFGIIPAQLYDVIETKDGKKKNSSKGVVGLDFRVLNGQALVTGVTKGLPAEKAGIKAGWEILRIGQKKIPPILKKLRKEFKDSSRLQRKLILPVMRRLQGRQGDEVSILFADAQGKEYKKTLKRVTPKGKATKLGNLPTLYVDYEIRKRKGIVYFRLNVFADPVRVMPAFEKAVRSNRDAKGFIIDIRGNPGGIGIMAVGIGNWFISGKGKKLGTMVTRRGTFHLLLNRRPLTYKGPLAVLVDGLSGSTSEILAGGLQDLGRAEIFGTPTMGAALPSVIVRLPNNDGFQYAIANYVSVGGKELEGNGVIPDKKIPLTREALLAGRDPVLAGARQWIEKQKDKSVHLLRPLPSK